MTETLTRTFQLDRAKSSGNIFPVVLTTEAPVPRDFGYEILDMTRLDLSRAPLPLCESHDTRTLNIGVVENLHVDGTKLRGTIRLGQSARAAELAADMHAGIVTSVSIGYQASDPIKAGEQDGIPVYRFAALIFEASLVSVPADIAAGINRSHRKITMETQTQTRAEQEETRRISTIEALAEKYETPQLAIRAIAAGDSIETFNKAALKEIDARNERCRRESQSDFYQNAGVPADTSKYGRAMGDYSLLRLLRGLSDPKQMQEAGLEQEISLDMQRQLGRRTQGVLMPFEALQMHRAVTVGGEAASLVGTDHMSGSFVDVLRNSSRIMSLGPRVLRGLIGNVDIPRKTSGGTAYWIAADDSDALTESDLAFDQIGLSPKTLGGAVSVSHKALIQSSPDMEMLLRQDLADLVASEIDLKALQGSGSSNQPLGVLATTGIGLVDFVGANPTYAELVEMESDLPDALSEARTIAWLMNGAMRKTLKTTAKQFSGVEGNFALGDDGRLCGQRAYRTGNMPTGKILIGDWSQLMVAFWGGIELASDPYGSNFLKGSVTVRVLADVDIAVRHPEAFVVGWQATP